ncbi:hypothetical protein LNQ81_12870 [Myroides sp. M-43]|uniref:hypothetical protein n=1 Tax=Myroides oncorhynchi TaxID=2893756 RepID=UPI001E49B9A2|nr:hypothetical protein [Myroides oncorhynchi]MCC9043566.1 hypothetical protein [Myroides oncorhynchi]
MKAKLLMLLLLWTGVVWGQKNTIYTDNQIKVIGLGITLNSDVPVKTQKQEIIEVVRKIVNQQDSKTIIGEIRIRETTIVFDNALTSELKNSINPKEKENINTQLTKLYLDLMQKQKKENKSYSALQVEIKSTNKKFEQEIIKIDSIKFDIREGILEFIKVYLNDGTTYSNRTAPIALLYLDSRSDDKLYDSDNQKFVLLKNVVIFDTDRRFGYLPDDGRFSLSNIDTSLNKKLLKKDNNLNSIVSFTAYSDLLGLLADQPNALVNFETKAKFFIHRKNIKEKFGYLFSWIEPYFNYNRVDSKFDNTITSNQKINPVEIFRTHNIAIGGNLSILRWHWRPSNIAELNFGYMFTSTNLVVNAENTEAINHIKYLDASLKSMIVDNFGATLNIKYMWLKLNDNEYFENIHHKMLPVSGEIFYKSSKKESRDKIFLRFTNYLIFNDRKQDFFQLQVGLAKALDF